jgi:CRISPR-associated endonuclease Cas1
LDEGFKNRFKRLMPSPNLPSIALLELHCRCLSEIDNLPHYHGAQWSALFRALIKPFLPARIDMIGAGIAVIPVETGVIRYAAENPIHLGLVVNWNYTQAVYQALTIFNDSSGATGHFRPGQSLRLESCCCRLSGNKIVFSGKHELPAVSEINTIWQPLCRQSLTSEIDSLRSLNTFSLVFHTPLRLTRPAGVKQPGHRYGDEAFFLDPELHPMVHFIAGIRCEDSKLSENSVLSIGELETPMKPDAISVERGALMWVDIPYGKQPTKTLGGVMGTLRLTGTPDTETALRLVAGQYVGAGKNAAFGLGYYHIPELDAVRGIQPLTRGRTLLERMLSLSVLRKSLDGLKDSSPGPDGLTTGDLRKAGNAALETLACTIRQGAYRQGPLKTYHLSKAGGGSREIHVQNVMDRLFQRAAGDLLALPVEALLSASSYAYRKGLNREGAARALSTALAEGYSQGFKADISTFFETVNTLQLADLLEGLFALDPLQRIISQWFLQLKDLSLKGLPQGSPLSPVLSNLYLDRFDRDMTAEGFRLIRYSDDFVVLFREPMVEETCMDRIETSLKRLGLALKAEKTQRIEFGKPIQFLGFLVTAADVSEAEKVASVRHPDWLPVFQEEWYDGKPVYLTTICRGAFASGPYLVIKDTEGKAENIPWNRISRIVVVGRSPFSGGVIYRAIKEEVPITFIDIMGRIIGHSQPDTFETPEMASLQRQFAADPAYCLGFGREVLSAKIHNSRILLRRNGIDVQELKKLEVKAIAAENVEQLLGYEGAAARMYFAEIARLVAPFEFKGRSFHPPDGPVNAMLSFGYTLLYNRIASVLKQKGFNPRIGLVHQGRGNHNALASDMIEDLRHIAERVMLALIHRREIQPEHFSISERKTVSVCRLDGEGFRKFIHRFEVTLSGRFSFDGGEKISVNAYLDEMADKLKRSFKLGIPYTPLRID